MLLGTFGHVRSKNGKVKIVTAAIFASGNELLIQISGTLEYLAKDVSEKKALCNFCLRFREIWRERDAVSSCIQAQQYLFINNNRGHLIMK